MASAPDFYAQAITRRRFGQWGLVAATAGVAGCGGGGEGEGPQWFHLPKWARWNWWLAFWAVAGSHCSKAPWHGCPMN